MDAVSSWWVTLHGHCHPYITESICRQAANLEQVIFANFTHAPAIELAERLLTLSKLENGKVFFCDNGSTAIEAALKIALQYWHNKSPHIASKKVICFTNAYHGDTFGAMSAAGKTSLNRPFWPYLFSVETIPPPISGKEELSINRLNELLSENDVACFIFEPILQGVSGIMQKHSAEGLEALLKICHQHHVIMIADEVMTGFGRTGPILACDRLSIKPDMICLSKGLTGGFLPLGATICRDEIYESFISDKREHAFLHGHSFCGNPLACAAANASIDLLMMDSCNQKRQKIEQSHRHFCEQWQNHPSFLRCETTGTILVIEYATQDGRSYFSSYRDFLLQHFLQNDIFVRPFGNVLYISPPYCITAEDLAKIYKTIISTVEKSP